MHFKKVLLFVILSTVAIGGCSKYLNGRQQDDDAIVLSDQGFSCLKVLPAHMRKLSLGEASDSEISSGFQCVEDALTYFVEKTRGSADDAYSAADMRGFFGKYFLKENNVSSELATQLMKFKSALMGGSTEWMTKDEVRVLIQILETTKGEMLALSPHLPILLLQEKPASWDSVQAAIQQLKLSLQRLIKKTAIARSDYSTEDLKNLLAGLADFVAGGKTFAPYAKLRDWVPVGDAVKKVLIGDSAALTSAADWDLALDNFIDLYSIFLKFHNVVKDQKTNTPEGLRQLSFLAKQVIALLNTSFQLAKKGEIPFSDIDNLIDQVLIKKIPLPFELSADAMKSTYQNFILRILDPNRHGESRDLSALTRTHLMNLLHEVNIFCMMQAFADQVSFENNEVTRSSLLEQYGAFSVTEFLQKDKGLAALEVSALQGAWQDFGVLLKSPFPVSFDSSGRYVVRLSQKESPLSWSAVTRLNIMHAVTRLLLIGYGNKPSTEVAQSLMKSEDLSRWYDDFRKIGLELKAFDPRNANSASRSFKEANFFTFSGNGNEQMDFHESFEFVSILFSAGLETTNEIRQDMNTSAAGATSPPFAGAISPPSATSCVDSQTDVFGYRLFIEKCFKKQLRQKFSLYFANLPGMAQAVAQMDESQWDIFYANLLGSARVSNAQEGFIETADIRTFGVILHYVEAVLTVYDLNRNGSLSLNEIEAAFPRFEGFLKGSNPGVGEGNLRDGFSFMVLYGKKPSTWDVIWFKGRRLLPGLPEASRLNLIKVLSALKEDLNTSKK